MSLQTNIATWQGIYDNTGITAGGGNPAYIGSVCATDGSFHQGYDIYQTGYKIWDFNWYAGQGIAPGGTSGGKFLVNSSGGFSWNTVDADNDDALEFVTSGSLNTLYLGTSADNSASPMCATLTSFNPLQPLIVVNGFNIAVDYVASNVFSVTDGNSAIDVNGTSSESILFTSLMSNPQYYESATLNSAILYDLAFETNAHAQQAFEFVLDQYLESIGSDITESVEDIQAALTEAGSELTIGYHPYALGHYPTTGCDCSTATAGADSDLLLAA